MGRSRYNWYREAVSQIRRYPEIASRKRELQSQIVTANYSGMRVSGHASRRTEEAATKELGPVDEATYDVVTSAIETMSLLAHGDEILRIVDMVDWKRTHNLAGAAMVMHMGQRTVQRYRREFILAVAIANSWR